MERHSVFSSLFLDVAGDTGAFRGFGLLRILRTVESQFETEIIAESENAKICHRFQCTSPAGEWLQAIPAG